MEYEAGKGRSSKLYKERHEVEVRWERAACSCLQGGLNMVQTQQGTYEMELWYLGEMHQHLKPNA